MALKALDGRPVLRQRQVFRKLVASINGIPVAAAGLQRAQNGLGVGRIDTPHKMHGFLPVLIGRADLALLALGDKEHGVGKQEALTGRSGVFR